jgi:hypothetical protein
LHRAGLGLALLTETLFQRSELGPRFGPTLCDRFLQGRSWRLRGTRRRWSCRSRSGTLLAIRVPRNCFWARGYIVYTKYMEISPGAQCEFLGARIASAGRGAGLRSRRRRARSGPARGAHVPFAFAAVDRFFMLLLCGRTVCVTAQNNGFRPGSRRGLVAGDLPRGRDAPAAARRFQQQQCHRRPAVGHAVRHGGGLPRP